MSSFHFTLKSNSGDSSLSSIPTRSGQSLLCYSCTPMLPPQITPASSHQLSYEFSNFISDPQRHGERPHPAYSTALTPPSLSHFPPLFLLPFPQHTNPVLVSCRADSSTFPKPWEPEDIQAPQNSIYCLSRLIKAKPRIA